MQHTHQGKPPYKFLTKKLQLQKKTISQTSGKEHYKCKQMQIIKSNIEITQRHFTYNNN